MGSIVNLVPRRALLTSLAAAGGLLALALVPHALGPRLSEALAALPKAQPLPLWCGGVLFVVSPLCSAGAWRTTLRACGGRIGFGRAAACFGAGSLANSLLPARVGDALRVALYSRVLPDETRVWTTGGIFVAMGAARAFVLFGLLVVAAASGALPVWPLVVIAALLAVAVAVTLWARRTQPHSRVSHLFDAFRVLGRSRRTACVLVAFAAGSLAARVGAVAATASALGVHSPLAAALVIVPALEVAGLLPLTPGNVGITSGAVAVALHAAGTSLGQALSFGICLHAVEMAAGLSFGATSVLSLAADSSPRARRVVAWAASAAAVAGAALAGALITG